MTRAIIEKWGGTSLATADRDIRALEHTIATSKENEYTIMVLSGPGKTNNTRDGRKATDHAYDIVNNIERNKEWEIIKKIIKTKIKDHNLPRDIIEPLLNEVQQILQSGNIEKKEEAKIIGLPERVQAKVMYEVGKRKYPSLEFVLLDYDQNGMVGEKSFPSNRDVPVDHTNTLKFITTVLKEHNLKGKIVNVPGFIGTKHGTNEMVTLERGTSDGTATYYGSALYADEVRIFSDQTGVLPVNPNIIDNLLPLKGLAYRETGAFSGLGCQIINDVALRPASERGILVRILNSFDFTQTGTNIHSITSTDHYGVKAIANVPGYQLITVHNMRMNQKGIAGKVSSLFAEYDLSIDSEVDGDSCRTYAIIPNDNTGKLINKLYTIGHPTTIRNGMARIALIGEGMESITHTNTKSANLIFIETLESRGIKIHAQTMAEDSVIRSCFIKEEYTHQAIIHLYRAFEFHRNGK